MKAHAKLGGHPSPVGVATVRVMGGIRRAGLGRGRGAVSGLRWEQCDLACAVAMQGEPGPVELRDVALLMVMSDALLRLSEVVALRVDDVDAMPDGSGRVVIKRSKTDQEGRGSTLYLGPPTMPAVRAWQEAAGVQDGALFRAMRRFVGKHAGEGATVYTDDHGGYQGMPFEHESVKHSISEYVNGMAHTNGIESFWALLKRGYHGTYHHMSEKNLNRYVREFEGRHNDRKADTIDQMSAMARGMDGKRLRYRDLAAA